MKKRLILLSDLWGTEESPWLTNYQKRLNTYFEVKIYDCPELGGINPKLHSKESRHKKFTEGGIEKAVQNLIALEKHPVDILAFSVGGTIAWKFGLQTSLASSITCVSSTRLRYETDKPEGVIDLYFGSKDPYRPDSTWFKKMAIDHKIETDQDHEVYKNPEFAKRLCNTLIDQHHDSNNTQP